MLNLLKDCLVVKASNGAAAGQTEVDSNIVDAHGYDAVLWVVDLGTVTGGCVLTAQPQDAATNSAGAMGNCGTAATYTDQAGESSNKLLLCDVQMSQQRFQRLKVTRTAANAVINTITGIFYRSKNRPATLDASVIASALSVATA